MKRSIKAYCSHCKHDTHKGRECGYGKDIGTTFAICRCVTDTRGRRVDSPAVDDDQTTTNEATVLDGDLNGPLTVDTRFAAALDEASRALGVASAAFATAAKEARIARASTLAYTTASVARLVPATLKTPPSNPTSLHSLMKGGTTVVTVNGETSINGVATSLDPEMVLRAASLGEGPRKVLAAMALYPTGAVARQLVAQTGFSARTITNYTSELRGAGLVERGSSSITPAGYEFLRANPISFTPRALEPGLRSVLVVMAKYPSVTARQICLHTKFSARTVTNYVSELRGRGYVVRGELKPTEEGRALVADEVGTVLTGTALFQDRAKDLGAGEAKLFGELWRIHPRTATSADLQDRTGFSARTITNYLSTLRGHMLVARGSIALSSEMATAHEAV